MGPRVSVIASASGNGKTTFGRALADRLGVPFVELDALVHGPNWVETPDDALRAQLTPVVTGEAGWVIDGMYRRKLGDMVLERADIVIWLDLPLRVWLPRLVRRTIRRARTREPLWNGNRESWRDAVGGRNSLFGYALYTHFLRRRRLPHELAGLPVLRLRTKVEVDAALVSLPDALTADPPVVSGAAGTGIGNPWESRALRARAAKAVRVWLRRPLLRRRGYRWGRRAGPAGPPGLVVWRRPDGEDRLTQWAQGHTIGPGLWKWAHYFPAYERHLGTFVGEAVHVVEIGVYSGGSLQMWRDYFGPHAHVVGIDVAEACRAYAGERIEIEIGDQADPAFWRRFLSGGRRVDVVIDDGGHQVDQQVATLEAVLPHLTPGGVYICEDVAGVNNLFHEYLAGLIRNLDAWNAPAPRESRTVPVPFQSMIASIHRYPYLVVIERAADPPSEFVSPRRGTDWVAF